MDSGSCGRPFTLRRAVGLLAVAALATNTACGSLPDLAPALPPLEPGAADVFGGVACDAGRPKTEPDLLAWDPGSRANLNRLRREGVVAVRYAAHGCDVELEVLSNCIGDGTYKYVPYAESQSKSLKSARDLFAELPLGAARLSGRLKGDRVLRADYALVGTATLPPATIFRRSALHGAECARATHVVSTVYLGGFELVSGRASELEGKLTVMGPGAGDKEGSSVERVDRAGDLSACAQAKDGAEENARCAVPLRLGLLPIAADLPPAPPVASVIPAAVEIPPPAPPPPPRPPAPRVAVRKGGCPEGMTFIPGGRYWMGYSGGEAREKPAHQVSVGAFCMDTNLVTVRAFAACAKKGDCPPAATVVDVPWIPADERRDASKLCNGDRADRQDHPVNCVSWEEATAFCRAAGKRLPTEEEWEYGARGSDGRLYPWGDAPPGPRLLNGCDTDCVRLGKGMGRRWTPIHAESDGWEATSPVGSFPDGQSPFGLMDMAGNVWQLTATHASDDHAAPKLKEGYEARGGSWNTTAAAELRATYRDGVMPYFRNPTLGFRCVRSLR